VRRARGGAERGTVTLWILGLACCTLPLGGLGVDLGRAVSARRALAATADAAALAGAGALDEARYRASGAVALDPGAAAARARESAAAQDDRAGLRTVTVDADPARVTSPSCAWSGAGGPSWSGSRRRPGPICCLAALTGPDRP
jgi:uncharacterized membrane protein